MLPEHVRPHISAGQSPETDRFVHTFWPITRKAGDDSITRSAPSAIPAGGALLSCPESAVCELMDAPPGDVKKCGDIGGSIACREEVLDNLARFSCCTLLRVHGRTGGFLGA